MVEPSFYNKQKCCCFWCFAGCSLFVVSIGLSIAISKTDGLVLGDSNKQLVLTRKAKHLADNAEQIEQIINTLLPKIRGKKNRDEAKRIKVEAIETKEEIEEEIED